MGTSSNQSSPSSADTNVRPGQRVRGFSFDSAASSAPSLPKQNGFLSRAVNWVWDATSTATAVSSDVLLRAGFVAAGTMGKTVELMVAATAKSSTALGHAVREQAEVGLVAVLDQQFDKWAGEQKRRFVSDSHMPRLLRRAVTGVCDAVFPQLKVEVMGIADSVLQTRVHRRPPPTADAPRLPFFRRARAIILYSWRPYDRMFFHQFRTLPLASIVLFLRVVPFGVQSLAYLFLFCLMDRGDECVCAPCCCCWTGGGCCCCSGGSCS